MKITKIIMAGLCLMAVSCSGDKQSQTQSETQVKAQSSAQSTLPRQINSAPVIAKVKPTKAAENSAQPVSAPGGQLSSQPHQVCRSMERPNIDCSCVAGRLQAMRVSVDDQIVFAALEGTYRYLLGAYTDEAAAGKAITVDARLRLLAESQLENFGGWPDEIEDFEKSCVVPENDGVKIESPAPGSAAAEWSRNCQVSDPSPRSCHCRVNILQSQLTVNQLIAETRGFSDYLGKPSAQPQLPNARALIGEGGKIKRITEMRDFNYCRALTFADTLAATVPGPTKAATPLDSAAMPTNAADLISRNCEAGKGNAKYCGCYAAEFKRNVIDKVSPEVAFARALFSDSSHMDEDWVNAQMIDMDPTVLTQAATLLGTQIGLGETCR